MDHPKKGYRLDDIVNSRFKSATLEFQNILIMENKKKAKISNLISGLIVYRLSKWAIGNNQNFN